MKTKTVSEMMAHMSFNKSLAYCGMSKHAWYYAEHSRDMQINPDVVDLVKDIASRRPTYGTRRMTSQIKRETDIIVNHTAAANIP